MIPPAPPSRLPFGRLASPLFLLFPLLLVLLVGAAVPAAAQPEGVLQLDDELHEFLTRQKARGLLPEAHLSHRPLSGYEAERYLDSLDVRRPALSVQDRQRLDRFQGRVAGPGVEFVRDYFPFLYTEGNTLFSAEGTDYAVRAEPMLYFDYGRARQSAIGDRDGTAAVWQNTRGVRIGGHIGDYIFFETRVAENQRRPSASTFAYRQRTVPRLNRIQVAGDDDGTYDYLWATGMVGFRSKHFEVRLGRDRNHWGPGETSLTLSDYAAPYDQLQLRTSFWRVQYTNVFALMTDLTPLPSPFFEDQDLPNKFATFHRLDLDLPGGVDVGLFESVVFAPDSSEQTRLDVEPAYLNPLIFYRAVERDLGSPDNVLIGADAAWTTPLRGLEVYGQFILDELLVNRLFSDFRRNKYGMLMGARLAGLPTEVLALDQLTLTAEYARMRPYLYAHRDPSTSYTHHNDLLGHPAGPNAEDFSLFARYHPTPRVQAALNVAYTRRGRATGAADSLTVGADPLITTDEYASNQAPLLNGVRQNQWLFEARAGYEVLPDLLLEATLRYESVNDAERGVDRYLAPSLALRWGVPFRSARY